MRAKTMPPLPLIAQIYLLCAGVGCLLVTLSALTGALHHHGPADGGAAHGGHGGHGHGGNGQIGAHSHGHAIGHDASGHHHSGDGGDQQQQHLVRIKANTRVAIAKPDAGAALLSYLSPTTMAAFATWFGACGLFLWRLAPIPLEWTMPLAVLGGVIGARLTLNFVGLIASRMYESHSFSTQDIIGLEAEVSVPVSATGMGEIIYTQGGTRHTSSARSTNAEVALARGAKAIICDVRDDVAYIEPWENA